MNEYEQAVLQKIITFGNKNDSIRAILLTSSFCNPQAPVDVLSDFDVELFFEDPTPFVETDEWIDDLGLAPPMAFWHWPNEWDHEKGDDRSWMRMVYFQDGTKMDITIAYSDDLCKLCKADSLSDHYDIGYRVLLDKEGVTDSLKPPTNKAYILKPPSAVQYASRIETFWMESTYVAKFLWRNDVMAAKWMMNEVGGRCLQEVLEWSVAMERGWNWRPGKLGRGLTEALDTAIAIELIESYAGGNSDDLWESLFRTMALYRKTAIKVGEKLGYQYPRDLDGKVTAFHNTVRHMDRSTADRAVLARLLSEEYHGFSP